MTSENHEAEDIVRLVEVLSRIAAAASGITAEEMASRVKAAISDGGIIANTLNPFATGPAADLTRMMVNLISETSGNHASATLSADALTTLQAFRDGTAAGETRLDLTGENQEAEDIIVKLVEVLSRIAAATPANTNSRTAGDMASWVYAVASTGLDIVKNRAAAPVPNDIQIAATLSVEALATQQAFRDGTAAGETRLDLVDNGSLAKAIDEVLARHATNEKVTA